MNHETPEDGATASAQPVVQGLQDALSRRLELTRDGARDERTARRPHRRVRQTCSHVTQVKSSQVKSAIVYSQNNMEH
jgi:hypothetical protein